MLPILALAVIAQVAQPADALSVYGPLGLTVGLVATVSVLWRDHLRADADDRAQRDRALLIVEGLVPAVKQLADAQVEANRDAAERHRRTD